MEEARHLQKLTDILRTNDQLIIEGKLNKNKLAEMARKYDADLLNLLQSNQAIKTWFFTQTDSGLVFKKDTFLQFISNKEFLPDSYTKYKNKIGLATSTDTLLSETKEVVLNWPYKECVLEGGQDKEDAKRTEVFFNEILAPDQINRLLDRKVLENWKRFSNSGEQKLDHLQATDNLIIRGNNLIALNLLKRRFGGKVKLIYIDPPYFFSNKRGEDSFAYNSDFKLSTWLTFMKNRLEAAKTLLKDDGAIFVQMNHEAIGHLKVLMDEIFSRDNFLNMISVTTKSPSGFQTVNRGVFGGNEYILAYGRSSISSLNKLYVKDSYDPAYSNYIVNIDANYSDWKFENIRLAAVKSKGFNSVSDFTNEFDDNVLDQLVADFAYEQSDKVFQLESIGDKASKDIVAARNNTKLTRETVVRVVRDNGTETFVYNGRQIAFYKHKLRDIDGEKVPSRLLTDSWNDISWMGIGGEGGVTLKGGKKPEKLMQRILQLGSDKGDIVLDYHAGSGTTAAVAHKMGRQYIGVEQLNYGDNDSVVRLQNVINGDPSGISKAVGWRGGGSFVYAEIKNDAEAFQVKVSAAKSDKDLISLLNEAADSSFLSYRVDPAVLRNRDQDFANLSMTDKKRVLMELVDKNTLYVNYSDIDDKAYSVDEKNKRHNREFYGE